MDLEQYVSRPDQISAADIASICQEAGMKAVRKNRYVITQQDFDKAYKTVVKRTQKDFNFYKWDDSDGKHSQLLNIIVRYSWYWFFKKWASKLFLTFIRDSAKVFFPKATSFIAISKNFSPRKSMVFSSWFRPWRHQPGKWSSAWPT